MFTEARRRWLTSFLCANVVWKHHIGSSTVIMENIFISPFSDIGKDGDGEISQSILPTAQLIAWAVKGACNENSTR